MRFKITFDFVIRNLVISFFYYKYTYYNFVIRNLVIIFFYYKHTYYNFVIRNLVINFFYYKHTYYKIGIEKNSVWGRVADDLDEHPCHQRNPVHR